jgi:hypothetical protein
LVTLIAAVALFAMGVIVLRLNPYWRSEPGASGILDHHVYVWNGVGHLLCASGLVCLPAALILLVYSVFKTELLFVGVAMGLAACFLVPSLKAQYLAKFSWSRDSGLTSFQIQPRDNVIWRTVVLLQVKSELTGYLETSELTRADGAMDVSVVRVLPVAWPTALGSDGERFTNTEWKRH